MVFPFICGPSICPVPQLFGQKEDAYSSCSIEQGTQYISPEHDIPIQAPMPPPPVGMAASKLEIQALQKHLKHKDRIIHAYKAQQNSHEAAEAEKDRLRELAKSSRGWRRHNANRITSWSNRIEGLTQDEMNEIKAEKVIFVTEYRFAMEKVEKMNAEAGQAEARVQTAREEQRDACRKTQELVEIAEELGMKVAEETRMRIAKSSLEENQDTTTTDGNTADSDSDVEMEGLSTGTAAKNVRLVLRPPQQKRSLSVEEIQPSRLRLSQLKREEFEERPAAVKASRPTRLRLSQPRAKKDGEDSQRVRSGCVLKASAKARK